LRSLANLSWPPQSICAERGETGLFGTTQDHATGALKPEFGWAVVHDEPQ
jgi:hypothetical protein